ncbi:glycosyltransferase [Erythrobacter sp. YT30]|uniref:glycosyltransferase family 2 protein n=1 Tax=Erythrobacter sp. YT30 TaxID=1735012 RepID=UPI00076CD288|nr:glycosyltransferase [Erythrobacter sp. YT30]KWV90947.1 hypothetical protein AUC45_06335 [Erythrobacter sp. YT30]
MSKRISFLMPTYNRSDYISEAIGSITGQMGEDDEIIVVDDGSSDATPAVLAGFGDTITHLRQENAGKSVALNGAMDRASGEFIWICDDDDLLCPNAAATLLNLIEASGADFVFGRYAKFTHRKGARVDLGMAHWPELSEGSVARHILEDAFVMHNATLARRSLYERVGPFDPAMLRAQDYDMFVRCAMRGRAAFTDELIFWQRKHEGARGPSAMLHAAGQSNTVWQDYDARIFERVYANVPLSFFEGMFAAEDKALVKRAGLLQRATVMARHDLWEHALTDWTNACEVRDASLTPAETEICRRAMAGKHGFAGALEPDVLTGLHALKAKGDLGAAIVRELVEGLVWRMRDPDEANRALAWKLAANLGARVTLLRGIMSRLVPGARSSSCDQAVTELSEIPLLD